MDMHQNHVELVGSPIGPPVFSHELHGLRFYRLPLSVLRLSGAEDRLNLLLRQEQLSSLVLREAEALAVSGELRSYNNRSGEGARLVISVLVKALRLCDEPHFNEVQLTGTLCKPPQLRQTPLGRRICDLMLAVNRRSGRSDYLPCICWGRCAEQAAGCGLGTRVSLLGRLQSRGYIKMTEGGPENRTAFEISASELWREEPVTRV